MPKATLSLILLLAILGGALLLERDEPSVASGEYYDIGNIHQPVTTESEIAQSWFDRGLAMCFGFNHEEAIKCFENALQADPGMAMAYWGIAYAWGPNINNMLPPPEQMAKAEYAIHLAELHAEDGTGLENRLIAALSRRYKTPVPEDRTPLNEAYVNAMRKVQAAEPESPLAALLFAESLMNLQPWKHWSPTGEPGPHTAEIRQVLEAALEKWPDYHALNHMYIHTMEASPSPEKALPAANRLRNATPGLGHLLHMPTHIDIWVGNYGDVVSSNQRAIEADKAFLEKAGPYNFYTYYRIHNYHFLVYGAMFDGQSELALQAARELVEQVPEDMLREQVDLLDAFMPTPLHVLVRFGKWDEILQEPEPADYLPVSRCIWHYARGIAYAAQSQVDQAEAEQQSFEEVKELVPETSYLFQNTSLSILEVAEEMLAGEIAYRRGEFDQAFTHLRKAVRRDDALNYDEPWGWMQPARHALGALLAEQGRFAEAEKVYRADLELHPNNPWALHGLAEALAKQDKTEEAQLWQTKFQTATGRADVNIDRACYCRIQGGD